MLFLVFVSLLLPDYLSASPISYPAVAEPRSFRVHRYVRNFQWSKYLIFVNKFSVALHWKSTSCILESYCINGLHFQLSYVSDQINIYLENFQ